MIRGIGVDMVSVSEMSQLLDGMSDGAIKRVFTENELAVANKTADRIEYLSTRFAAKEAVFKAVSPASKGESLDFRIVETLNRQDGSPYLVTTDALQAVLNTAKVSSLHISIATEGNMALAFVIAE